MAIPSNYGGDSQRFDKEGFLRKLEEWTPAVAAEIATSEGIQLGDSHWELVNLIRQYYRDFDSSPSMRPLVKYTRLKLGAEKGKSIYLLSLFPGSPAKIGSKIAGLPKPDNCL